MQRDTKKNYQLYGRNDMIMLDEHNKIYGSLGLAEPYIVATKEGETLLLDGAKDNEPFIGLSVFGKSTQDTTTGAQLFDANQISDGFVNGVNAGESFTVSTNPAYPNAQYVKVKTTDINIIAWNLTGCVKTGAGGDGIRIRYFDAEGVSVKEGSITTESGYSETENTDSVYVLALYGFTEEVKSKAMVNAGSTSLPWEPYTGGQPSPNPDYPQEIESAGDDGNIGVDVYGGNFLTDVTDKVISGDVGDSVNDARAIWNVILDKNLLDKELIFSFDSDSNIGRDFLCQIYVIVGNSNKWSGETCKQIAKGRNYFSIAKVFDELPEENVTHVHVQLRINKVPTEELQFTVSNPMLNIGSTALPFESYKQPQSLIVSTPNGLPGIPVSSGGNYTDENGQQWISDEIDFKRGKYVQRVIKRTFGGNENIIQNVEITNGIIPVRMRFIEIENVASLPGLCDNFSKGVGYVERFNLGYRSLYLWISVKRFDSENPTIEDVKNWLDQNPVTVYASLKTPIETDLTPEQITAYQSLHTNYPTTTVMNDSDAGMKAIYKQIENGG